MIKNHEWHKAGFIKISKLIIATDPEAIKQLQTHGPAKCVDAIIRGENGKDPEHEQWIRDNRQECERILAGLAGMC